MLFTIRFAGQNLKFEPERGKKQKWLTDGFYSWTEDWPHTCSPVPDACRRRRQAACRSLPGSTLLNHFVEPVTVRKTPQAEYPQ